MIQTSTQIHIERKDPCVYVQYMVQQYSLGKITRTQTGEARRRDARMPYTEVAYDRMQCQCARGVASQGSPHSVTLRN